MEKDKMLELKVKPRFDLGERLWFEDICPVTGKVKATKVVVIGYRLVAVIRMTYEEIQCQYLVVKARNDNPEIDVHRYADNYQFLDPNKFHGIVVLDEELYYSKTEILSPDPKLN